MADERTSGPAKPPRRPSIKDVASLAGVSWRTVSNVIHGHQYLRPETKAKVEAAIAELDYRPQAAARQLRSGRSHLITLAVPYIAHPYFASLAHAVVEEAEQRGYIVLIDETRGLPDRESQVAKGYSSVLSDGIIFSPLDLGVRELATMRDTTPLVLLGEHTVNTQIDHVVVDNVGSTREATEHLIGLGRRRIAFLGYLSQGTLGTADLRFEGYRQALAAAGIAFADGLVIGANERDGDSTEGLGPEGDYSRDQGYLRAKQLLPRIRDVDAVVCANDLLALGMLKAFREAGVRVPEDVAVTGWDNAPDGAYSAPTLTTIAPDMNAIARLAIETLRARMNNGAPDVSTRVAPHRLVVRESTVGAG